MLTNLIFGWGIWLTLLYLAQRVDEAGFFSFAWLVAKPHPWAFRIPSFDKMISNTSVAFGQATSSGFLGSVSLPLGQRPLSPFLASRWMGQYCQPCWRDSLPCKLHTSQMVHFEWRSSRFCCSSPTAWSSLKLRSVNISAKPDLICGNEQRLSRFSFQKLFHKVLVEFLPIWILSQLPDFLVKLLTNLVLGTRWSHTFFATITSESILVLVWKNRLMTVSISNESPHSSFDVSKFRIHLVEHCMNTSGPLPSV